MKAKQHVDISLIAFFGGFCELHLKAKVCLCLSWLLFLVCVLQNWLQQWWVVSPAWKSRPVWTCTENQTQMDFMSQCHQQRDWKEKKKLETVWVQLWFSRRMMALPLPDASLWVCAWSCDSVSDLLLMFVSMCDFLGFTENVGWPVTKRNSHSIEGPNTAKLLN